MLRTRNLFAAVTLLFAAACGGGGSSAGNTVPHPASTAGQGVNVPLSSHVDFGVTVPAPAASASSRKKQDNPYVSSATQSVSLQLSAVDGASLAVVPTATIGNVPANCTSGCAFSIAGVPAAPGTDRFLVKTFAGRNATGALISQAALDVSVTNSPTTQQLNNPTELSVGGIVASIGLSIEPNAFTQGTPSTANVVVSAKDPSGALIVGPVQFPNPILVKPLSAAVTFTGADSIGGFGTLSQPESTKNLLTLSYDGSLLKASISASMLNADGSTISSPPVSLNINPAPTASPPPFDLYVLNGDNTIAEFDDSSVASTPGPVQTPQPRRVFGGATVGCAAHWDGNNFIYAAGADGLTADALGNIYVSTGPACSGTIQQTFYAFGKSATGGAAPSLVATDQSTGSGAIGDISFNVPAGFIDVYGLYNQTIQSVVPISSYSISPGTATIVANYGSTCIVNPISPDSPPCSNLGHDFVAPVGPSIYYGAAEDAGGNYYTTITDNATGNPALVEIPAQVPSPNGTMKSSWIEDPLASGLGPWLAVDANTLYVLENTSGTSPSECAPSGPAPSGTQCADGSTHLYLIAYDLSAFSGTNGVTTPAPKFVLGGDSTGRFQENSFTLGILAGRAGNALAVHNGYAYIAHPSYCSFMGQLGVFTPSTCSSAPNGEIDVYDVSQLTGYHMNDVAPVKVIAGPGINLPQAVVVAPRGTGLGSNGLRRATLKYGRTHFLRRTIHCKPCRRQWP